MSKSRNADVVQSSGGNNKGLDDIQQMIGFMLDQFKLERYVYVAVVVVSFLTLLVCVVMHLASIGGNASQENLAPIIGMMGSGGAISYTAAQLLRMWRDCIQLYSKSVDNAKLS